MTKLVVPLLVLLARTAHAQPADPALIARVATAEVTCQRKPAADPCLTVAGAYNQGTGGKAKDPAKAAEYWERACTAKSGEACNLAGDAYELGRGVTKDAAKAEKLFAAACDRKYADGCESLASVMEARGADAKKIDAVFAKGCNLGSGGACFRVATSFGGEGPKLDYKKSIAAYRKSCDLQYVLSCTNLGVMMSTGMKGAPNDPKKANELLQFSCDKDDRIACSQLANNHFAGRGTPKDRDKSIVYRRKACKLGHPASCEMLDSSGVGR